MRHLLFPNRGALGALVLLIALACCATIGTRAAEPDPRSAAVLEALPDLTDVKLYYGFKRRPIRSVAGKGVNSAIQARRRVDALKVAVSVTVADSIAVAKQGVRNAIDNAIGAQKGCPSGRKLGDESWWPTYGKGVAPNSSFYLVVREGRSVVQISLAHQPKIANGAVVKTKFPTKDLRMAEDTVLACLAKLRKRGLTGR